LAAATVAVVLTLSACGSGGGSGTSASSAAGAKAADFKLVTPGVLTVSPYSASPPAITISADKKLGGFLGDVINGFAQKYNLKVEVTQTTFASSLLYVQQDRSDMTPFVYHTDERAKSIHFTSSLFQLPVAAITKKSFQYTGPDSLKGKKISAVLGQVWGAYLQKEYGSNALLFQKDAEAAQALLNGQVDAYVNSSLQMFNTPLAGHNDLVANPLKAGDANMPANIITNVAYNVVSCKNPKLAAAFDAYLRELQSSGQMQSIYQKNNFPENFRISAPTAPQQGC
jgi:ABC-type amino acid transport substrate-binding protein